MTLLDLLVTAQKILNSAVPVIIAFGMVYFVWGIVQYVIAGGEEAKKKGRDRIVYGIIALAVIVSLWGLVNILVNTFGLGGASAPTFTSTEGARCNTGAGIGESFASLAGFITCTIKNAIIPFIFAAALVTFIWGVVKFLFVEADEEAKRSQGKQFMIWGLIALTVMISVWGLVRILGDTFGLSLLKIPITETE